MDGQHLKVVRSREDDQIVQGRAARNARIDKLSVDRSCHAVYQGKALPGWSPEANAREPKYEQIRADVTASERLMAWRGICALPKVSK